MTTTLNKGDCMVTIYSTTGSCRQFIVTSYDYALARIDYYKNNWKFYKFATLAYFTGECWVEIQ